MIGLGVGNDGERRRGRSPSLPTPTEPSRVHKLCKRPINQMSFFPHKSCHIACLSPYLPFERRPKWETFSPERLESQPNAASFLVAQTVLDLQEVVASGPLHCRRVLDWGLVNEFPRGREFEKLTVFEV